MGGCPKVGHFHHVCVTTILFLTSTATFGADLKDIGSRKVSIQQSSHSSLRSATLSMASHLQTGNQPLGNPPVFVLLHEYFIVLHEYFIVLQIEKPLVRFFFASHVFLRETIRETFSKMTDY